MKKVFKMLKNFCYIAVGICIGGTLESPHLWISTAIVGTIYFIIALLISHEIKEREEEKI